MEKMEYRNLDLTIISATGLKEVNKFRKIHVYAVAKIKGVKKSKKKTKPDKNPGTNPTWNHPMRFVIDEPSLKTAPPGCGFALVVKLKAEVVGIDKRMGKVYVPIHQLFDDCGKTAGVERLIDFQVKKRSGKIRGSLKMSYLFGEKYRRVDVTPAEDPLALSPPTGSGQPTPISTSSNHGIKITTYPHHMATEAYPQHQYSPPHSGHPWN